MPRSPKAGRPKHRPTADYRRQVETMAGLGYKQTDIIQIIGIGSTHTLHKYYRNELDRGMAKTAGNMLQRFYERCLNAEDWRGPREWLRVFGPDVFRNTQRVELTGADGGPLELSVVDQILRAADDAIVVEPKAITDGEE